MNEDAVKAAREFLEQMMEHVRAALPDLRQKYGDSAMVFVGYKTLLDVLSKYHARAVDLYGYDEYTELPDDQRNVFLPEDTVLAYVLTMDRGGKRHWFRLRGVAPGAKVSGMYAKATDALLLGTAAMDAVLFDYVGKKCASCPARDDCRTIALFEFARGLVGAMESRGYDPVDFIPLFLAAVVFRATGNYARVLEGQDGAVSDEVEGP